MRTTFAPVVGLVLLGLTVTSCMSRSTRASSDSLETTGLTLLNCSPGVGAAPRSQSVDQRGGVIRLGSNAVFLPVFTLTKQHTVTVRPATAPRVGLHVDVSSAPGLARGAIMTLSYAGCPQEQVQGKTIVIVRLKVSGAIDRNLGGANDTDVRTVTAIIPDHMSEYALATM